MTEIQTAVIRPDADIVADIHNLIAHYPPAVNDRHQIKVSAVNGEAIISGHVKTPITRRYLLEKIAAVEGVTSVNSSAFYVDETIRLDAGKLVPPGVQVIIEYGIAILAGKVPAGSSAQDIESKVASVPGVHKVVRAFQR